jgi:hypothetical protein
LRFFNCHDRAHCRRRFNGGTWQTQRQRFDRSGDIARKSDGSAIGCAQAGSDIK